LLTLLVGVGLWCWPEATLTADVPHLIRYQGHAVDAQGVPLEGPYDLIFRLYDAETGGTEVWEETQTAVPLTHGHFSVLLGQVTPLQVDWNPPLWLSVQVGPEPELIPRQRITSVPLAIKAEVADMAQTAERAEQLTVPMTTSTITDDANKLVPSGAMILWDGASCPAGYTRVSALDGALLKAGSTATLPVSATVAELPTHSHSLTGSTSSEGTHKHNLHVELDTGGETALFSTNPNRPFPDGSSYEDAAGSHSHSVTGTIASTGTGMVATVLLCQKD
jgi:hypothetical protein